MLWFFSFWGNLMWEIKTFQSDYSSVKPRIRKPWKPSNFPILSGHSLLPFPCHVF